MSDLVIQFYDLIMMMVKYPDYKRQINWRFRFFNKRVSEILAGKDPLLCTDAVQMTQELALCRRRRGLRRWYYNLSNIDEVYAAYHISRSPLALNRAWDLFHTGRYKAEEVHIYA